LRDGDVAIGGPLLPVRSGGGGKTAPRGGAVTIERIGPPLQEEGWVVMVFAGNPLDPPPSSTDGPGVVGEHCLSAQRELRSRPVRRAAQGTPEGGGGWGRLLFSPRPVRSTERPAGTLLAGVVPFLGEARKGTRSPGGPGMQMFVRD
jgi:hypothetical protein